MGETVGVILAAGHGKRMKSDSLKVLHPVMGIPMIHHVVAALSQAGVGRLIAIVGQQRDAVKKHLEHLGETVSYVSQEQQLGTGHALAQARPLVPDDAHLVVLCGDTPLLTAATLEKLMDHHRASGAAATLLTAEFETPRGYGRIIRDEAGSLERIVEEADATPAEAAVRQVNAGIYCFRAGAVFNALGQVKNDNAQGEYYLVDVVPILRRQGLRVETMTAADPDEVVGVNDRRELARAGAILRRRVVGALWEQGVSVLDENTVYIDPRARIGRDTVVFPFTVIEGPAVIGQGCRLGPGAYVSGGRLGNGVRVFQSVIEESEVGDGVSVGPFSHLRSGCNLAEGVKVGNFAEIKNTSIGRGTKVPHHSYLGDAVVGEGVNVGAGAVTVNYNGVEKSTTHVGDGAFIGCNANLIAPVKVEEGGYVAAGSTINKDVPGGALAIARARQENKPGWAKERVKPTKKERQPDK